MMKTHEIYKLIDDERDYQQAKYPDTRVGARSFGDYLTLIEHYFHKAQAAYRAANGDSAAMGVIREIAGLGVRCMEELGAAFRDDVVPRLVTPLTPRQLAYMAIRQERAYQISKWIPKGIDDANWYVGDWLVFLRTYINKAYDAMMNGAMIGTGSNVNPVRDNIRKITALCVAAMEHINTPSRAEEDKVKAVLGSVELISTTLQPIATNTTWAGGTIHPTVVNQTASNVVEYDLTTELWREYDTPGRAEPYRIENPQKLYFRTGGTTHRVVDADGQVHCVPAVGYFGTVLRWASKDAAKPVNF
jgi:hypothetical protein